MMRMDDRKVLWGAGLPEWHCSFLSLLSSFPIPSIHVSSYTVLPFPELCSGSGCSSGTTGQVDNKIFRQNCYTISRRSLPQGDEPKKGQ